MYLYWFQIFKDQCGSVPSIPVAVRALDLHFGFEISRTKNVKNAT